MTIQKTLLISHCETIYSLTITCYRKALFISKTAASLNALTGSIGRLETKYESYVKVTVVRIKASPHNRILHRSSSANTGHPNISFALANYRQCIVLFAESELWYSSFADWLRSVFYCYILIFGKTNTMAIVTTRNAQ